VEVPRELFAPEPSDKAKALVNRFFGGKGTDQCGFRKRFIASVVLAPLLIVFGTIAKVVLLLFAALLTKREYELSHLWHPFSGTIIGVIDDTEEDTLFWWQEKNGQRRNPLFFIFNHIGLFLIPAVTYAIMHFTKYHGHSKHAYQLSYWGWWKTFLFVDSIYLGILVAGLLLAGIFMGTMAIGAAVSDSPRFVSKSNRRKEQQHLAQRTAEQRRREEILRELEAMVCTTDSLNKTPSLKDLPRNKLTVSLLFNGAKTAVCKPFAK
jgi:hypothetical protein